MQGEQGLSAGGVRASFLWQVLAMLVIVALLAKWTWLLFAPRSASVLPAVQPATDSQAEHLFGIAAASGVQGPASLPNMRLVGVFAGKPGFAILELDGKRQVGFTVGKEIVAGAKLVELAIDHVVIEQGGVRQRISLENNAPVRAAAK